MASPTVEDYSTSVDSGTTHTVDLPSTMTTGATLIIGFATDGDESGGIGWPDASYHPIVDTDDTKDITLAVAWHKVTGSEGTSITVTTVGSEISAHVVISIINAENPDDLAPEATDTTGDSISPDPPSHTASQTGHDLLWIGIVSLDTEAITGFPTNLPDDNYGPAQSGPNNCDIAIATDGLTQDTFNPDAFTGADADEWCAATICVYPDGAYTPPAGHPTHRRWGGVPHMGGMMTGRRSW